MLSSPMPDSELSERRSFSWEFESIAWSEQMAWGVIWTVWLLKEGCAVEQAPYSAGTPLFIPLNFISVSFKKFFTETKPWPEMTVCVAERDKVIWSLGSNEVTTCLKVKLSRMSSLKSHYSSKLRWIFKNDSFLFWRINFRFSFMSFLEINYLESASLFCLHHLEQIHSFEAIIF